MENDTRRAIDSYQNEVRFRAIAQSVVAQVKQDYGRVDPEHADEDALEIATRVAALMLQRIYDEDAELAALRIERDQYKQVALEFSRATTMRVPTAFGG